MNGHFGMTSDVEHRRIPLVLIFEIVVEERKGKRHSAVSARIIGTNSASCG